MEAERMSEPNGYGETNKSIARNVVNPSFCEWVSCVELLPAVWESAHRTP
jgi:hypothetical protein